MKADILSGPIGVDGLPPEEDSGAPREHETGSATNVLGRRLIRLCTEEQASSPGPKYGGLLKLLTIGNSDDLHPQQHNLSSP